MSKAVFCIAPSEAVATAIVNRLKAAGIAADDVSALFPDRSGSFDFAHEQHTKLPEGAAAGVGVGGVLGAGLGWLVGAGSFIVPGLGPFVAAGPFMAMLSGAAAGAALGGVSGALIGLGIPEYEAKRYSGKIKDGNILISVHTRRGNDLERIRQIFKDEGAEDIAYTKEAHA